MSKAIRSYPKEQQRMVVERRMLQHSEECRKQAMDKHAPRGYGLGVLAAVDCVKRGGKE